MPVILGAKPESNFSDPFGLLSDCHRRIEAFLGVLVKAAALGNLDAEGLASLRRALDYFRNAAPKHTADEEESLFPRLRQSQAPEAAEALALVASLERDHEEANRLHTAVDELGRRWLEQGTLGLDDLGRFGELVARLQEIYAAHIVAEDQRLFPVARRALAADAAGAIGREMAARRR